MKKQKSQVLHVSKDMSQSIWQAYRQDFPPLASNSSLSELIETAQAWGRDNSITKIVVHHTSSNIEVLSVTA
jgi:hypothetical protein